MKAIKFFASLLMLFTLSLGVSAQTLTKAQEKAVKKQVKEFQKEGWKVKPGSLSLTKSPAVPRLRWSRMLMVMRNGSSAKAAA